MYVYWLFMKVINILTVGPASFSLEKLLANKVESKGFQPLQGI